MYKVIKEFNNEGLTYQLGYDLLDNKVYPRLETYKMEELVFGCSLSPNKSFSIGIYFESSYIYGNVDTIKETFNKLRQFSKVPEKVEMEYEKIFLLYKRNDFKEF